MYQDKINKINEFQKSCNDIEELIPQIETQMRTLQTITDKLICWNFKGIYIERYFSCIDNMYAELDSLKRNLSEEQFSKSNKISDLKKQVENYS